MAADVRPTATVESTEKKTTISVEIPTDKVAPQLLVAPDTEVAEHRRRMIMEHADHYGEPQRPGGILSYSQEKGDEPIPGVPGGVVTLPGALNLATELQKLEEKNRREHPEQFEDEKETDTVKE